MNSTLCDEWSNKHLDSKEVGYDTVLPPTPMYSLPQYCSIDSGLLPSLKESNYSSASCLLFNRTLFYLSTYKSTTYIDNFSPKNLLLVYEIQTSSHGLSMDDIKDSSGNVTATRLANNHSAPADSVYVALYVTLPRDTEHTFSAELWADQPSDIEIALSQRNGNLLIAKKRVSVTTQPQRFFISGKTLAANDYNISIGNMFFANDKTPNLPVPSPFYARNPQLETGTSMTEYNGNNNPDAKILRPNYPLLLAVNVAALLAALLFLIRIRQTLLVSPVSLFAVSVVIFSFAQALIIIPEQRFVVVPMIFIWLMATAWLVSVLGKRTANA